jgi:hypothetical protein
MDNSTKKSIVEYVLGMREELILEGEPTLISVTASAVEASKNLYVALNEGKNIEEIKEALQKKKKAVDRWNSYTNKNWDI